MAPAQHQQPMREDGRDGPTNADLKRKLDEMCEGIDEIRQLVTGGSRPSDGIIVRLDRVEQAHESRKYWTQSAVGAALAAMIASLWAVITNHKGS